jgi:predicted esterase
MRPVLAALVVLTCASAVGSEVSAKGASKLKETASAKPWCAPEVKELSEKTCFFDGGAPDDGRRTLVVYLHGALAMTPGFAWLQQRAMAFHAKRHGFTVVIPTGPSDGVGYVWPTSQQAQKEQEPAILAGIQKARADVEKRVGHPFDETFVVGFSSGAYYGSSLALRSALDVDGYIVLAGGSSWVKNDGSVASKRAPVFVGVSAADPQTAGHSRSFAGSLGALKWPFKVEERNAGHMVDWTFLTHGIAWLREQSRSKVRPVIVGAATQ